MTKTSDRYAKWFGTRVPILSRSIIVLFTFFSALLFSVVIHYRFGNSIVGVNFLLALFFSLVVGVLTHILYLIIVKIRYSNPSPDPEFHNLVGRIHQKVAISSKTHIWIRQSQDVFIASVFTPLYDAIIISEPMVGLMMQSPESGEALLAFHLLRVPRTRWFGELVGSVIFFVIFTFLSSLIIVPATAVIVEQIVYQPLIFFYALYLFAIISMFPILFIFLVKGAFWRHEPAFDGVHEIYCIHPNVAKVQVERGVILDEDEAQTVVWAIREWEKSKRYSRRIGISTMIAIPVYIIGTFMLIWSSYGPYAPLIYFASSLPLVFTGAAWLLSYYLLKRWDKNAMGEVFRGTTDYDEPIWMD